MKTMIGNIEGRFLAFIIGRTEYAVEIQKVREILGSPLVDSLSRGETAEDSVLKLRSKTVPVVNLRRRLGQGKAGRPSDQCIVTVMAQGWDGPFLMGFLVDGVREIIEIRKKDTGDDPGAEESVMEGFLQGPVRFQGRQVFLLDVDGLAVEVEAGKFNSIFGGSHEVF